MSLPQPKLSFHADRFEKSLFTSLWVEAWGSEYPEEVAPFSSCTSQLLQQLDKDLRLNQDKVLVDMGCGTGGIGLWLARQREAQLIGIDRCPDAIAIASKRASDWELSRAATFFVGDFCETKLPSASADAAISVDALPAAQNIESAFTEIRRVLRPRGVLIFTAREHRKTHEDTKEQHSSWREGLETTGFEVTNILERPEVSDRWRRLYKQWIKHEAELRRELLPETVDALMAEARRVMPTLDDHRPWLLINALKTA